MEDQEDIQGENPQGSSPKPENLEDVPVPDWAYSVLWPPPFGFTSGYLAELADKHQREPRQEEALSTTDDEPQAQAEASSALKEGAVAPNEELLPTESPTTPPQSESDPTSTSTPRETKVEGKGQSSDSNKGKAAARARPPSIFSPYAQDVLYFPAEESNRFFRRAIFEFMSTISDDPLEAVENEAEKDEGKGEEVDA